MDNVEWYKPDWNKVNTLDTLIEVIKSLDPRFSNVHPRFEKIKHLLVTEVNNETN